MKFSQTSTWGCHGILISPQAKGRNAGSKQYLDLMSNERDAKGFSDRAPHHSGESCQGETTQQVKGEMLNDSQDPHLQGALRRHKSQQTQRMLFNLCSYNDQ